MFFILPCIDNYQKVDLRVISFDVPPQEILTRDSVTITVDAVTYFRISNPIASVCNVEDFQRSTRLLAQTTLKNELGTKNLSEVIIIFWLLPVVGNCRRRLHEIVDMSCVGDPKMLSKFADLKENGCISRLFVLF